MIKKISIPSLLIGISLLVAITLPGNSLAQKSFGLELGYVTGFQGQEITIVDENIEMMMPHGGQLTILFAKRIKETPWLFTSGIGGKYISTKGQSSSGVGFTASSFKMNGIIGAGYSITSKLDVGLQFAIETNRDFQEMTYAKSDLWRYFICAESTYALSNKWGMVFRYWRSLSPNKGVYLVFTPVNQISLGVNYFFNEL